MLIIILLFVLNVPAYTKSGDVSEYYLANGLKLIVKEDHRAPIAIVQVWYKVGSSYESSGLTGISHALEHMMFRGTKKYSAGALSKIIVDNGGAYNAGTNRDHTVYYETLSSDKLPIVFDLESDRMHALLLDESEFTKEKQVVLEERKMTVEDNPNNLTYERFAAVAFASNPYRTPVIGWMHDIQNLTHEDLMLWYKNWYAPNNAIIVVVGDVQPDNIFEQVNKYFGAIPQVEIAKPKLQKEITPLGERNIVVNAPAELPFLIMGYNAPTLKTVDQNQKWKPYALSIIQGILSGGGSARLNKDLVRDKQIAANIFADYGLYSRLDDLFMFNGVPTKGHTTSELKAEILQQIKKLQTTLVSKEELERIKAQVISEKIYSKDSIAQQASEIGGLESMGLSWMEADQYLQNIKAITSEQIQLVAKEYLIPDRLTVAELQPIKAGI